MPKKTHGYTGTRLYNAWLNMKQRCFNPNTREYLNYGGRGITICNEWIKSFECFKEWALSNGYAENLTLDRIKINENYSPNNCRWITNAEQQLNRRDNYRIEFNGEIKILTQWAKTLGFTRNILDWRLKNGWPIDKALTIPKIINFKDLSNQKFGRIKVISFAYSSNGTYWNCICDCGTKKTIRGDNLTSGLTKSCGCLQKRKASLRFKSYQLNKKL